MSKNTVTPRYVLVAVASLCALLAGAAPSAALAGTSGSALPDGRVVELVSTSGNVGEPYFPASPLENVTTGVEDSEHPFQAAENGEAVTYVGEPAATGGTGETGPAEGNQWLATRTPGGWKTGVITPESPEGVEYTAYQAFSADLSADVFIGPRRPLAPEVPAGCRSLYARAAASGEYRALFTSNATPEVGGFGQLCGRPLFAGASEDESQVIFQSEAALTEGANKATEVPPGRQAHSEGGAQNGEPCTFGCSLYDSVAGHPRLVSIVGGKPVSNANFGGYPGERGYTDFSNAISTDGSRIFWTDTQPGLNFEHVYVLEDGASTVQVSGAGPAEYWTATPDGHYAFYTEAGELWRFDTHTNEGKQLTTGGEVQGVIGTNRTGADGAYLYFVAGNGELDSKGVKGVNTQPNLYLRHEGVTGESVTTFIATLLPEDNELATSSGGGRPGGDWKAALGDRTAEVTPDGRHLVFQSVRSLAGYNNVSPSGNAVVEVFHYSADDAQLACASCDPTGAPPVLAHEQTGMSRATRLPVSSESNTYMRRWISVDGNRVFFDSEQPLVPGDLNGVQDVYEWEREGTGTCAAQTPSRLDHGCVSLLSGANGGFSFLVDADATGDNVFLEHVGPLGQARAAVGRNELYDVRVNGGFSQSSLACSGTGCQGVPPAPPLFATPASVTFAGVGNFPTPAPPSQSPKSLTRAQKLAKALRACRAKPKRERAACERLARRRYGARGKSKAKRSRTKGGK
jgi:hypothetical protein